MDYDAREDLALEALIQTIFSHFQYDFRLYSRASLKRRLIQANIRFGCDSISELEQKLIIEQDFFPKLIAYLTVNTTEIFRDPDYFKSLKENVFPYLQTFPSLKIWCAGCSTGEEVISLAILLREMNISRYIIYATDINPMNLETAKHLIYSRDTVQKGMTNYQLAGGTRTLSDYFEAAYDSVKFDDSLLSNVVFSDHSLATDHVFSEMHFVSCRNVLIYFERSLQERALKLFDDSLVRDGFLGLGSKETIQFSGINDHFRVVDQNNRLYQKKAAR